MAAQDVSRLSDQVASEAVGILVLLALVVVGGSLLFTDYMEALASVAA